MGVIVNIHTNAGARFGRVIFLTEKPHCQSPRWELGAIAQNEHVGNIC
jgi:hypothetical protein